MLLSVNGETAAAERKITQFSNAHMAILALGMFIGMMCQMVHPHCWNSTVTWAILCRIEQGWVELSRILFCFWKFLNQISKPYLVFVQIFDSSLFLNKKVRTSLNFWQDLKEIFFDQATPKHFTSFLYFGALSTTVDVVLWNEIYSFT